MLRGVRPPPPPRPARAALRVGLLSLLAGCSTPTAPSEPCGWQASAATLLLTPNLDDDDRDGTRDGLGTRAAPGDDDLVPLSLASSCPPAAVRVRLEPAEARDEVRVLDRDGVLVAGHDKTGSVVWSRLPLSLDVVQGRHGGWAGEATLVLEAPDLPPLTVALSARPIVRPDVRGAVSRAYAVALSDPDFAPNTTFLDGLRRALPQLPLVLAAQADTGSDRWMQDAYELGVLGGEGPAMRVWIQLDRAGPDQGLSGWAAARALAPGVGVVFVGASGPSSLSGGGNLDVLPVGPYGRWIVGRGHGDGARAMAPAQRAWLDAQGVQGPALEVDTDWLETGHLDEIFQPLWVEGSTLVAVSAAPRVGLALLHDLPAATRVGPRSAGAWRRDAQLAHLQARAAERIDALEATVAEAARPLTLRWIRLPVLFGPATPEGRLASLLPNATNLVHVGQTAVVSAQGVAAFDAEVRRRLESAGLTVVALDVSAYAPHGGGVHCALLLEREPLTPRAPLTPPRTAR